MPVLKWRHMGASGLVKDTPPTSLPPQAFTRLQNVQFRGGAVERSGVFRPLPVDIDTPLSYPVHGIRRRLNSDNPDTVFLFDSGGFIWSTDGKTVSNVSVVGHTANDIPSPVTSAVLGGCVYFARGGEGPVGFAPTDSNFASVLAGTSWATSTWRLARSFDNRLFLINGTDGSTLYPRRVMWSDPASDGTVVDGWDTASLSSTAGWVDMPGINGELLDAQPLGNQMLLYGDNSVRRMYRLGGGGLVYENEEVFDDDGVLATGLVVPIVGVGHLVVGKHSIYVTDGVNKKDIAANRMEEYFRDALDSSLLDRAFAFADYRNTEAWICYVSNDSEAHWGKDAVATYANQALVWNWRTDTFSMRDLPNVSAMAGFDYAADAVTWADLETESVTWDTVGGTWAMAAGSSYWFPMIASQPYGTEWTTQAIATYDDFATGRHLAATARNTGFAMIERIGLTADELGVALWSTKAIPWIVPMVSNEAGENVLVSAGGSQQPETGYTWSAYQAFDATASRWVNTRIVGRYLGLRIRAEGTNRLIFTGLDAEVKEIARR